MTKRMRRELLAVAAFALVLRLPVVLDGWFGADKIKHLVMIAAVQSFAYSVAQASGADRGDAMRISLATAAAAGLGREIYDGRVKQRFSVTDLVWDGAGIAAATAMLRHSK